MSTDDALAQQLARLTTIEAARTAVFAYADIIDRVAVDELPGLMAADARLTTTSGTLEGLDAILDFYRSRLRPGGRHFVTNTRILSADAERVLCTSYFLYTTVSNGESILGWGDYLDELRMIDGQLRITSKQIAIAFRGPLSEGWAGAVAQ